MPMILALGLASGAMELSYQPEPVTPQRLRSSETLVLETIQEGIRRSPTFAELVQVVERSDFFVYVERVKSLPNGMRGCLLHGGGGPRYLRVLLALGMSRDHRIEVLAHELQHVREVIEAGIGNDPAALDALFKRIGDRRRGGGYSSEQYETSAALRITSTVVRELRADRRRTLSP